jgi:hypothetical protein
MRVWSWMCLSLVLACGGRSTPGAAVDGGAEPVASDGSAEAPLPPPDGGPPADRPRPDGPALDTAGPDRGRPDRVPPDAALPDAPRPDGTRPDRRPDRPAGDVVPPADLPADGDRMRHGGHATQDRLAAIVFRLDGSGPACLPIGPLLALAIGGTDAGSYEHTTTVLAPPEVVAPGRFLGLRIDMGSGTTERLQSASGDLRLDASATGATLRGWFDVTFLGPDGSTERYSGPFDSERCPVAIPF